MYRFILFYFVLYICIYLAPWCCEARHLVPLYVHTCSGMTIKLNLTSNQIKSKSLLLSHHHSTSALVSEILMSVLQTVQKKQQTIYIWTDSAKKLHWSIYSAPDSEKKQQQFTYGQYIFTDCTEDNVQNTHTYTQYT